MKRLIVYSDGTWNDSDKGTGFTNVARLCWATYANDDRLTPPMPQIGYYHSGVGTGDLVDRIVGGGVGAGLARNVRDAYSFLASNYCEGDQILLFGFSRGAYTARSIAGLIGWAGLLHKRDMDQFAVLWQSYKLRGNTGFVDKRETSFPDRHRDVKVSCVGVWDTVGSLGIPGHLPSHFKQLYQFLDTGLGSHIENAFHAIALDELTTHRSAIAPRRWPPLTKPRRSSCSFAARGPKIVSASSIQTVAAQVLVADLAEQRSQFAFSVNSARGTSSSTASSTRVLPLPGSGESTASRSIDSNESTRCASQRPAAPRRQQLHRMGRQRTAAGSARRRRATPSLSGRRSPSQTGSRSSRTRRLKQHALYNLRHQPEVIQVRPCGAASFYVSRPVWLRAFVEWVAVATRQNR